MYKAYFLIGFLFFSSYLQAQDQNIADSLVNLYAKLTDSDSLKMTVLHEIAFYHTNPDSALKYSTLLVEFAEADSNHLWLHRGFIEKGHAYKLKGDLEQSLFCYFQSLDFAQRANYMIGVAGAQNAIAGVYRVQGNQQTSFRYYNQAIDIFRRENDTLRLASSLLNTGDLYRESSQLDTALLYFEESQVLYAQVDYEIGIAYSLGNIGLVYAEQGRHAEAEKNIKEATLILEKLGDRYPIAVYDTYMADIYREKGDFQRALKYAQRSYDVSIELGLKEQTRDASLKLSELYQEAGNYEQAYTYQSKYLAYRDSINNEETIRQMADLRTEYEVSQKQVEVDLLEEQKRSQQIVGISLIVVLLLVVLLAFVLYKNNRQKQATNLLLSEQKEEIAAQRDQLEDLNDTKDRFFSIISHDLRGPVSAFKGVSNLIKLFIEEKDMDGLADINEHFDKSVDQMSVLLDNLLDWAVTQQGAIPYTPEQVSLSTVFFDDLHSLFVHMAQDKKITLTSKFEDDLVLWADVNSLKTILRNLINNAIKFTEEEGEVSVVASANGAMADIRVTDNGVGISKEKLDVLFGTNKYNRSWGTSGEKGLGLGLQLVYDFALLNHGTVRVESEERLGTTFIIELPLYDPGKDPESAG
ncbi:tetratricopeptide repeat-containing sensor histidine kinase [Fulvivirga sp. M361]|uniref:sensor histidine kinase n=1 Tax=Fulvivirga sp. M361 TaxID=2594266 RepID=UPI00162AD39F|nr:tetratricopeptide repeat-containing sensor histidine kinase [Fulvivirga sp. M361]